MADGAQLPIPKQNTMQNQAFVRVIWQQEEKSRNISMNTYKVIITLLLSWQGTGIALQLTSPAFKHNGQIPLKYTCDGENISPALRWTKIPPHTKSFALIVDDPDAPKKVWVHWILFNIPVTVTSLPENAHTYQFVTGLTDFNDEKYGGPCPPSGTHRYHFTLYALDSLLNIKSDADKNTVLDAMRGHILEQTTLIGTYTRSR